MLPGLSGSIRKQIAEAYGEVYHELVEKWAWRNEVFQDRLLRFARFCRKEGCILDLGCGFGRDVAFFSELGFKAAGIDICEEAIALGREIYGQKHLKQGDILSVDAACPWQLLDGIWCRGVIFHLDREQLRELSHKLYMLTASGAVLYFQAFSGTGYQYRRIAETDSYTHYFFHQRAFVTETFINAGFEVLLDQSTSDEVRLFFEK
ncbi:class I SAM-dependent methyltransferase [Persicimonas caeni]|uniref:Class I SAM-dependent methyltransferase n=1 Tax=Persicimonas caeni TaxID=2292766 RepID=A0A4Y6PPB9_PERCE|nr:class I SAM-dependent methyltransferase [Persicimonas caeni]QDG50154.1 class I SAM-dependent methyltransferase [Persicimonas caeni]QED31375.1 class I SAM-dependent methyltransferase [Persicimonas caeni]